MEFDRREPSYRPKEERVQDFQAVEIRVGDRDVHEQAARCMDCGTPFCHGYGCPLSNLIPEFNDLVYKGRWQDALVVLLETNCLPEFTGRICPAPCEPACVLSINDRPVTIREIELAIIERGFERGYIVPRPPSVRRDERVAVVGSGPAGLAAADLMNRAGLNVTVYENAAKPGGILRYGIPDFKLEKWVVDRRVQLMKDEGIVFETGVEIGRDISQRYLSSRFDAVVLTGGARAPRDLSVPGRELSGVHFAMDFLTRQNRINGGEYVPRDELISAEGKRVVVIGGGDTGSDCVGTSVRQGAVSVLQLEILPEPPLHVPPETPWPQWPNVLRTSSSHKEGGERRWSVTTREFRGEAGRLTGLVCAEVKWVADESGGRPSAREVPGSEFNVQADLVLLAMGFVAPGRNDFVEELGIGCDERGFIVRDRNNMTSEPGVFVAGDMTQGASLVVRALADGQKAGRSVIGYLVGEGAPGAGAGSGRVK